MISVFPIRKKTNCLSATLDEAYDALVKVEDALDSLGMKLGTSTGASAARLRNSSRFLYNLVLVLTSFMTPLNKRCSAKKEFFRNPSFPHIRNHKLSEAEHVLSSMRII
jgi:hypothetical protein